MTIEHSVPGWARALDALTLVAFLLFLVAAVFGAVTMYVGPMRVSLRASHVLFVAVAATAIRHAAHPGEPLPRRARRRAPCLAANLPLSAAAAAVASRVAVLVVGYLAVLTIGVVQPAAGLELSGDPLFNLPARFDAGWYGGIALDGYSFEGRFDKQQNLAFFPAMPLLMRTVGVVAGAAQPTAPRPMRMARALWAGVLISLIAFAWAAHYLVRLARDTIGEPRALGGRGVDGRVSVRRVLQCPVYRSAVRARRDRGVLSLSPCGMAAGGNVGFSRRTDPTERLLPHAGAAVSGRRVALASSIRGLD